MEKKNHYERDLLSLNLFFLDLLSKSKYIKFDVFIGYTFDKEVYNSKLIINKAVLEDGYKVYYVDIENGEFTNIQELQSDTTYTLLQDFTFQNIYTGVKYDFIKTWIGYCNIKTRQPVTWWSFGRSPAERSAIIIRSDITFEGLCGGIGFNKVYGKQVYIYIPKLLEMGPLRVIGPLRIGKYGWTKVNNAGLSPRRVFQVEAGSMIYISSEIHFGLNLKHFFLDVMYNPYWFRIEGKRPMAIDDRISVIDNIVHRITLATGVRF